MLGVVCTRSDASLVRNQTYSSCFYAGTGTSVLQRRSKRLVYLHCQIGLASSRFQHQRSIDTAPSARISNIGTAPSPRSTSSSTHPHRSRPQRSKSSEPEGRSASSVSTDRQLVCQAAAKFHHRRSHRTISAPTSSTSSSSP